MNQQLFHISVRFKYPPDISIRQPPVCPTPDPDTKREKNGSKIRRSRFLGQNICKEANIKCDIPLHVWSELWTNISKVAFRHPRVLVHLHVVDQPIGPGERRRILADVGIAGGRQSCTGAV